MQNAHRKGKIFKLNDSTSSNHDNDFWLTVFIVVLHQKTCCFSWYGAGEQWLASMTWIWVVPLKFHTSFFYMFHFNTFKNIILSKDKYTELGIAKWWFHDSACLYLSWVPITASTCLRLSISIAFASLFHYWQEYKVWSPPEWSRQETLEEVRKSSWWYFKCCARWKRKVKQVSFVVNFQLR